MRNDPAERWYEALRQHSPHFRDASVVMKWDSTGTHLRITDRFGKLEQPVAVSRIVALQFASVPAKAAPMVQAEEVGTVERRLRTEQERRGALWALLGRLSGPIARLTQHAWSWLHQPLK
jgi:hypothetical protein